MIPRKVVETQESFICLGTKDISRKLYNTTAMTFNKINFNKSEKEAV